MRVSSAPVGFVDPRNTTTVTARLDRAISRITMEESDSPVEPGHGEIAT
jgi:hypothetical protein